MKWQKPPPTGHRILDPANIETLRRNPARWALLIEREKRFTLGPLKVAYPDIEFTQRKAPSEATGKGNHCLYGRARTKRRKMHEGLPLNDNGSIDHGTTVQVVGEDGKPKLARRADLTRPPAPSPPSQGKRAPEDTSSLTEAVLNVLEDFDGDPVAATQIAADLEDCGWEGTVAVPLLQRVINVLRVQASRGNIAQRVDDETNHSTWTLTRKTT